MKSSVWMPISGQRLRNRALISSTYSRGGAAGFGGGLDDLVPVFVGAGEEKGLLSQQAVEPGHAVGHDGGIGVPQVGLGIDVIDGCGDVKPLQAVPPPWSFLGAPERLRPLPCLDLDLRFRFEEPGGRPDSSCLSCPDLSCVDAAGALPSVEGWGAAAFLTGGEGSFRGSSGSLDSPASLGAGAGRSWVLLRGRRVSARRASSSGWDAWDAAGGGGEPSGRLGSISAHSSQGNFPFLAGFGDHGQGVAEQVGAQHLHLSLAGGVFFADFRANPCENRRSWPARSSGSRAAVRSCRISWRG